MIKSLTHAAILTCIVLLTGCCPNGCFVVHGDLYQRLAHPKPYIENWEKPGADSAVRGQDSAECGGGSTDRAPSFGPGFIRDMQQPGESENATYVRLFRDWQRCMIKKGYRYTGYCSAEYAKVAPACGAP